MACAHGIGNAISRYGGWGIGQVAKMELGASTGLHVCFGVITCRSGGPCGISLGIAGQVTGRNMVPPTVGCIPITGIGQCYSVGCMAGVHGIGNAIAS